MKLNWGAFFDDIKNVWERKRPPIGTTGSSDPFLAANSPEGATVTDGTVVWTVVKSERKAAKARAALAEPPK